LSGSLLFKVVLLF